MTEMTSALAISAGIAQGREAEQGSSSFLNNSIPSNSQHASNGTEFCRACPIKRARRTKAEITAIKAGITDTLTESNPQIIDGGRR
jgi:hypothetical protein